MTRILLLLALSGSIACAESRHFLWKVTGKGSELWLLGSIHMGKKAMYPLDSVIENAFDESEFLAVEIDISQDTTILEVSKRMALNGTYPKGDSLSRHIAPELYTRLDSLFTDWQIPTVLVRNMRPWYVTLQIGTLAMEREGINAAEGIDLHFLNQATEIGKTVIALETVAEQADLFVGLPDTVQEAMLTLALDEVGNSATMVDSMFMAWSAGDTLEMEKLALDGMVDDPRFSEFRKLLYTDRNKRMAQRAESFLRNKKRGLVVVGSAHLVGSGSVVRLLRERGYGVVQY
jgi:uncharacterized protein YbaP (TraB family)